MAAERAAHANDQLGVASTGFSFVVAGAAALCTVMRNPQRSRLCAAKSPSVTSCRSTKESALRKRLRVELAIAYIRLLRAVATANGTTLRSNLTVTLGRLVRDFTVTSPLLHRYFTVT